LPLDPMPCSAAAFDRAEAAAMIATLDEEGLVAPGTLKLQARAIDGVRLAQAASMGACGRAD
jgi:hypothetical protein